VEKKRMIRASVPAQWDDFTGLRINMGVRERLHEEFDVWLNMLEGEMEGKEEKLDEIVRAIFERRHELTGMVAESLVEKLHSKELEQTEMVCPKCGRVLTSRDEVERTVETMVGEVKLKRPYFWCEKCSEGFYLLDEALNLSKRRKQWDIQKAGASLAAELPYEEAEELFKELTGLSMSDHTMHEVVGDLCEGVDVLDVAPSAEEIKRKIRKVGGGKKWRPIMVLATDGAHVPTRPERAKGKRRGRKKERAKRANWEGEWREAKGFRFYLVDGERIEHILSWHQVQSDKELKESLKKVKEAGLIPEDEVRLCVIADGARWIWKVVKELYPEAVEVLDYYHLGEHLHKLAEAQYGHGPERAQEWIEATLTRLFTGEANGVIWGLERMKPRSAEAKSEIDSLIGCLKENKDRVDYKFYRKGGYPVGSGGIESSNKTICHVRLKRSGAWWYVEKANQMLALRCAKYNGTFQKIFLQYSEKFRHT
jgi:hypothetical protein